MHFLYLFINYMQYSRFINNDFIFDLDQKIFKMVCKTDDKNCKNYKLLFI